MSTDSNKKNVGRPPAVLNWPNGEFTIETLRQLTRLSKVTLYGKVSEAIEQNKISIVGREKVRRGHPRIIYKKVDNTPIQTTTANDVPSIATLVNPDSSTQGKQEEVAVL